MKIYKGSEISDFLQRFESRRANDTRVVENAVTGILENVRTNGDAALKEYASKFDRVDLDQYPIKVSQSELEKAHQAIDPELIAVIRQARANIEKFHSKALPQSWLTWEEDGVVLGQRITPIEKVGVYVPGGLAAYPSSLLMGVVPAQVAGVKEIYITTPCNDKGELNQTILAAACELGVSGVFRVGGAHAIAALAYGTQTVPRVDKIVGPGNIYVATAKKLLYGQCGIDMVAGPSEVLIIADKSANPEYVAADLLAQAEHDPLASAIMVTDSSEIAQKVSDQVLAQTEELPRSEIIEKSLADYGGIVLYETMQECIDLSNFIAPEHLGIHTDDAFEMMSSITNAGAIFLGQYSPEAVGDYWAGPNHVLPTNGSGRFFSPLRTEDFLKVSSVISYTKEAIQNNGKAIEKFAMSEGLQAHAKAIIRRMDS